MARQEFEFDPSQAGRLFWPVVMLITLVAVGYLVVKSVYTVQENENAVVLRFGKYHATTTPGFHFCIPIADEIVKVNLTEERRVRLPFGVNERSSQNLPEDATLMLTGDLNAASVEWTVQWRIDDPKQKILSFYNPRDPGSDTYVE